MYIYEQFDFKSKTFDTEKPLSRIGKRIRTVREEKGMTQGELGEKVGLNANRIQQYENSARVPKFELCKKIAEALDVEVESLLDPRPASCLGAMFAFFEMEKIFDLRVTEIDGRTYIHFGESQYDFNVSTMNMNLKAWYERRKQMESDILNATSQEEKIKIFHEYNMWEWNFPHSLTSNDRD